MCNADEIKDRVDMDLENENKSDFFSDSMNESVRLRKLAVMRDSHAQNRIKK